LELAKFEAIAKQIREKHSLDIGFGENVDFSLPVVVRRDAAQYDAMFFFERPKTSDGVLSPRPFAWVLLDAVSGQISLLSRCDLVDFMPEGRLPMGSQIPMTLPRDQSPKKVAAMQEKAIEAYEEIRAFAFQEKLSRSEANLVSVYKDLFGRITYPAHYAFYHALSPVFFHWLRMPLPMEAAGDRPADESAIMRDNYQLLILENLRQLVIQFDNKIQSDNHKEQLFDEMHRELQSYKNDLLGALTLSMERDVIQIIDDVAKSMEAYRGREPTPDTYQKLLSLFEGVETDLCDLLYRHGVEPYTGDTVDVARQKVVHTVPTNDPSLDKTIAARLARGWEKEGKIIRPERVSGYVKGS
jgi:molecular chaperone GrpE (heat shock protein)